MSRKIQCSKCGKRYLVEDDTGGKSIKCKVCNTVFTIPEMSEDLLALLRDDDEDESTAAAPAAKKKKKKKR